MSRIEERYSTAVTTSDLHCDTREGAPTGDVDVMIAAGWSKSRIGSALLRLHTEFDSAARPRLIKGTATEAATHNLTEAFLFFGQLKTLPKVIEQIVIELKKWGVETPTQAAEVVLFWWLDKNCSKCQGRRYEVIPGTGRLSNKTCKACNGTGERAIPQGLLGKRLANYLDSCVELARRDMSKALHGRMKRC